MRRLFRLQNKLTLNIHVHTNERNEGITMKNRSKKYLRSYYLWEQTNEQELYEILQNLEEFLNLSKKYLNLFLYFLNLVSKKIILFSFIFLRSLFLAPNLKRQIAPNQIAEDVSNFNGNVFHF